MPEIVKQVQAILPGFEQGVQDRKAAEKARRKARQESRGKLAVKDDVTYSSFTASDYYEDGRMYDYNFLISQADMQVADMPALSELKEDGKISREKAFSLGLQNLAEVGTKDGDVYAVINNYTKRPIYTGINSLRHSMRGDSIGNLRTNARLAAIAGNLIQNAIPINALKDSNEQVAGTYAMATIANSGDRQFVVIITVEQHNNLQRMEAVDVTHAISGRIKNENRSATRAQPLGNESYGLPRFSSITISDFLDVVKDTYRSILPVSVQNHYGKEKLRPGYYTGKVRFSIKDESTLSDREILANTLYEATKNPGEQRRLANYKNKLETFYKTQDELEIAEVRLRQARHEGDAAKIREAQRERDRLSAKLTKIDSKLLELKATKPLKELLTRVKADTRTRTRALNRERRSKTELRTKIRRLHEKMSTELLKPKQGRYVPKGLLKSVAEVLEAVNTHCFVSMNSSQARFSAFGKAFLSLSAICSLSVRTWVSLLSNARISRTASGSM